MVRAILVILLVICFVSASLAETNVTKRASISLLGGEYKSADEARAVLLNLAKQAAVQEIFGEFISSLTKIKDFSLSSLEVETTSVGYIRVRGNPRYYQGEDFGEVCVEIDAYVTDEDLALLDPKTLTKKVVVADPDLTLKEVEEEAKVKSRLTALVEYDQRLKPYDQDLLLPLLHEVKYSQGEFIGGTTAYSIEMTGVIYPLEIMTLLQTRQPYGPPVPLVTGLPASAFTASTYFQNDAGHAPWLAKYSSTSGASNWSAHTLDTNQWLQVDLGNQAKITAVGTMGRYNGNRYAQWATSYQVSYSLDGSNWQYCGRNGSPTVFKGNSDYHSEVRHTLEKPIIARFVRFHPVAWYGHITMRAEVYGSYRK
jgi:hypothetical protein